MRNFIRKMGDMPYALLAAATVSVVSTEASAASSIGDIAKNLHDDASNIGKLVTAGVFVGGLIMLGTGLLKLKQAAENPNQTKYSEGIWRVAVGAAMVGIPAFTGVLNQTLGLGGAPGNISAGGGQQF